MPSLTQHINSKYFEAANHLAPKNAMRKIIAYVESYDDILFWRTILNQVETKDCYFEVMLPSFTDASKRKDRLGRGKKSVLKSLMRNSGGSMIACVDADYDYLLQGSTESSQLMLDTPYVFHTYVYAIENLQCYSKSLHDVCVMSTLNDHRIFDFSGYMASYSAVVYPLFVWSVILYRENRYDVMSISDMDKIIRPGRFVLDNPEASLAFTERNVRRKLKFLKINFPELQKSLSAVSAELESLGVTPLETYLYIHGHFLFEKVVLPMLNCVCTALRKEREYEISSTSLHLLQKRNELACYSNSVEDLTSMLKKNTSYLLSPQVKVMIESISQRLGIEPSR